MKYFAKYELECKCGCSLYSIAPEMEKSLDMLRSLSGIPLIVTSGSGCEKHNRDVGGSKTSSHLKGLAVDIAVKDSSSRFRVLSALIIMNINRIGIYDTFIHFDIDPDKAQSVLWYN